MKKTYQFFTTIIVIILLSATIAIPASASGVRVETTKVINITETNATVYGYCAKPQSTKIETCGVYFGTSSDNMYIAGSDVVSAAANNPKNGHGFEMWYDLNKNGTTLEPGTTYYWQAYATYNGIEYTGEIKKFTTAISTPMPIILPNDYDVQPDELPDESDPPTTNNQPDKQPPESDPPLPSIDSPDEDDFDWDEYWSESDFATFSVTELTVSPDSATLEAGSTISLRAIVAPDYATDKTVIWESSNPGVVRVDANGTVTGVGAGSVIITATAGDGSGQSDSSRITVTAKAPNIRVDTTTAKSITQTNAVVYGYCAKPQSTKIETCGVYLGTSPGNMKIAGNDIVSAAVNNPKNGDGFEMWYDLNKYGVRLQPGTTYYWQAYATYNGVEYRGSVKSFITLSATASSNYIWPVKSISATISRGFSSGHSGIDIGSVAGHNVHASRGGTLWAVYTGCNNNNVRSGQECSSKTCSPSNGYWKNDQGKNTCNWGNGNGIVIKHSDGTYASYAHMQSIDEAIVDLWRSNGKKGTVAQDVILGKVGATGNSNGAHLHFELRNKWNGSGNEFWGCTSFDPQSVLPSR